MLDLNAFAKEVHAASVAHGWWEKNDPDNNLDTKIALIHAEWSEALEEYRVGRPMVWYKCGMRTCDGMMCDKAVDCRMYRENDTLGIEGCSWRGPKPEGIAVELIDGVLRIMDLVEGKKPDDEWNLLPEMIETSEKLRKDEAFGKLICLLHMTTGAFAMSGDYDLLIAVACAALKWVQEQGIDPWELLRIKHEYNKNRPYKHGGKKC